LTEAQTSEMKRLDDLASAAIHPQQPHLLPPENLKARDMNLTLGSKYMIMSSSDPNRV
jgi:hypothetical protein